MKALVLSDLHLGSKASKAAQRLSDIARVAGTFDRVILNGDTLDRCYVDPTDDDRAMQFIADARSHCASRNGPPEILTGNHDPVISETHWIYDEASETLIFHGDCIRDYTHPTKKVDQQLRARLEERWAQLGGRPKEFTDLHENYRRVQRQYLPIINPYKKAKTAFQYAMALIYPPRRPFDIVHYWMKAPELAWVTAMGFAKPLKHVVVGHTHKPGKWRLGGVDVFNTGSYMPLSGAYAVCVEDTRVSHVLVQDLVDATRKVFSAGPSSASSKLVKIQ